MKDDDSIIELLEKQNEAFEQFKGRIDGDMDRLSKAIMNVTKIATRPNLGDGHDVKNELWGETRDGKRIPILRKSDRLTDFARTNAHGADEHFDLGRFVRESMHGKSVTSGPALVPTRLSNEIIDDVRAQSTVVQAGSVTIPIDGPTTLARITGDATVYQHAEAVGDITASDMTVAPVTLNPKTLAALVPLSMEVAEDSPNLNVALRTSLSAAFAAKLDALCLATILADANIPKSAVAHDPVAWAGVLLAVGAALAANQPLPLAMIGNAADFMARASQLASTAGSWLGKPPVLANMAELPTTKVAAGLAILGGFEAFAIAVRQDLTLEVVRYAQPTSATHYLVATARVDGVVLQPKRLFIEKKVP